MGYLLRHPEKKRVVDVKSFVEEWDKDCNRGDKYTPGIRVPHSGKQ